MTWGWALAGVAIGVVSGVLSGLFGVGGGIVMTPLIDVGLGAAPIVALATPLAVIVPTSLTGALTYRRAGQVDVRASRWMGTAGILGAVTGAALTEVVPTHLLLVVTATLLAWQSIGILRGARRRQADETRPVTNLTFAAIGLGAGVVSGLLGIGGGLVMVPVMAGWLGMPLKRALGTSLATIVILAVPGVVVHSYLGNIDWSLALVIAVGAVPGAYAGARIALGAHERTLRLLVGGFMLLIAVSYGVRELTLLLER